MESVCGVRANIAALSAVEASQTWSCCIKPPSFSHVSISQGSVAPRFRCGGFFMECIVAIYIFVEIVLVCRWLIFGHVVVLTHDVVHRR